MMRMRCSRRGRQGCAGAAARAARPAALFAAAVVLAAAGAAACLGTARAAVTGSEQGPPADPALRESAFAWLWADHAERAIEDFRRYLQGVPAGQDRQGRLGLALAYSWAGRQDDAAALYRQLLDEDPTDAEAQIGHARSLIWDNELRTGFAELREVEEARAGTPGADGAGDFLLTVLDDYTPLLNLRWEGSWDSDDLDISRVGLSGAFAGPGSFLLLAEPQYTRYSMHELPCITGRRLGAGAAGTLRRNVSVQLHGWVDAFSRPGFLASDRYWTRGGTDSWLTWLPTARVRLDGGVASLPVESYAALDRKIAFTQGHVSADWRVGGPWSAGLVTKAAHYGDGNDRTQASLRLTWRRDGRLQVWAGPVVTYMEFRQDGGGAYWAPARVRNASLETTLKTRTGRLTCKATGSLGLEQEGTGDTATVGGGSLRIGWRVAGGWLVAVDGGHARSALGTASGYRRTFAGVSLRGVF